MSPRPGNNAALCVLLTQIEIKMLLQAKRLGVITNEPFDRLHGKAGGQERCWINVLLAVMILIASLATSGPVTSPGGKELRPVVAESAEAGARPA